MYWIFASFHLPLRILYAIISTMHLQKPPGLPGTPEPSLKNTPSAKTPQTQSAAKPAATALPQNNAAVSRSVSSLAAAAGLPADKLSASIISFARFFSLPLKPELMAEIRRQAFSQQAATKHAAAQQSAQSAAEGAEKSSALLQKEAASKTAENARTAFSLAAAAAESKGVELNPRALETFADAIDPDAQKGNDGESFDHEGQSRQGEDRGNRGDRQEQNRDQDKDKPRQIEAITAAGLKDMALETMEKNPLLEILNRLPGKDGQRWIVLPFDFCENGRSYRVSLRVLLGLGAEDWRLGTKEQDLSVSHMALDIAESADPGSGIGPDRRLFVITAAGGKISRLSLYLQSEIPPKAKTKLKAELSKSLEITPEHIFIKTWTDPFPLESAYGDEFPSIDEAV